MGCLVAKVALNYEQFPKVTYQMSIRGNKISNTAQIVKE